MMDTWTAKDEDAFQILAMRREMIRTGQHSRVVEIARELVGIPQAEIAAKKLEQHAKELRDALQPYDNGERNNGTP